MMTGAYAMGAPWLRFAQGCGPRPEERPHHPAVAWLAWMTGGPGRHAHPFADWNLHNGPGPFGPGDIVEIEIEGIGILRNRAVAKSAPAV